MGFEEISAMGWQVAPWSLGRLLLHVQEKYKPSGGIYVLENGVAIELEAGQRGEERRKGFLEMHAAAIHCARAQGADVRGYFVWTLMDNFEWAVGTRKRFGLLGGKFNQKDLPRMERQPSCNWYRGLCQSNTMQLEESVYRRILDRPRLV